MTDESSDWTEDWAGEPDPAAMPLELDPQLPPEVDLLIRNTLAGLDRPKIPEVVAERIAHALAAEPALGAQAVAEKPDQPAHRRNRHTAWLIALPGAAAACVIGLVVGSSMLSQGGASTGGSNLAAIVPMSASGVHYQQAELSAQVASQLPRWRYRATMGKSPEVSESATTASPSAPVGSPSPTPPIASPTAKAKPTVTGTSSIPASADPADSDAPVEESVRQSVTACIQSLGAGAPMYVDVATYRAADQSPELRVAVIAVPSANSFFEVYVVDVGCTNADQVRAHLHLPAA